MCLGQYEELFLGAGLVAHWWTQQAYIGEGGMALGKRMSGGHILRPSKYTTSR